MNCTRALSKVLGLQGLALVLLVALVASISSGIPSAHASSLGPELSQPKTVVEPQTQEDEDREGESELPWLFAVFAITWAAFFGYVFVMSRRQQEMQREIEALKRALAERERQKLGTEPGPGSRES